MVAALWFLGLLALLVATLFASARARAAPADVVGRGIIAIAGVAYVGLVVAAVWTWGGAAATAGRATQLRDGAQVRMSVDGVRIALAAPIAIGHAHDAALRIPGDGGEIARVELAANGHAVVRGAVIAVVHGDGAATMAALRGCAASDATYTLPPGAAVAAIECEGSKPLRAFVVRHARRGEIVVAPLTWRGRFVTEQLTARVGDALRIGGADDAIPGLTTWDIPAPHGAAAMVAIPADPTDCAAWAPDMATRSAIDAVPVRKTSGAGAGTGSAASGSDSSRGMGSAAESSGRTGNSPGESAGSATAPSGAAAVVKSGGNASPNSSGSGSAIVPGTSHTENSPGGTDSSRTSAGTVDSDALHRTGAASGAAAANGASAGGGAGSAPVGGSRARAVDGACVVDAGAFVITAVPLVPDAERVVDRGLRAAFAIGGPPLILLVALVLAARRDRRTRVLGRALRLCMLGASLTALCCWRLLWAHRIDMLRELASVGPRVIDNQLAVIAIGAALAGNAMLA
ncbi:MAG TPA: hypothetical protein VGD80_41370, partial [Kofleriaceae bacterium]